MPDALRTTVVVLKVQNGPDSHTIVRDIVESPVTRYTLTGQWKNGAQVFNLSSVTVLKLHLLYLSQDMVTNTHERDTHLYTKISFGIRNLD